MENTKGVSSSSTIQTDLQFCQPVGRMCEQFAEMRLTGAQVIEDPEIFDDPDISNGFSLV